MVEPLVAEVVEIPTRRGLVRAVLVALRPRQWSKNLLVFAGILFAAELGDGRRWGQALVAFAAYCAASSASYLANDVRDAGGDRLHPVKRRRPVARRELDPRAAILLATALALVALGASVALGVESLAWMALFLALQAAYSLALKAVILVDVAAIAALFVIRAVAGAAAVDVPISPWLPVCAGLLALVLALGKRRAELVSVGARSRVALEGYTVPLLDQLLAVASAATLAAYVVYTLTARDSKALAITVPLVVYGLFRYLLLLHRRGAGEEPERLLLRDAHLIATLVSWAIVCGVVLERIDA